MPAAGAAGVAAAAGADAANRGTAVADRHPKKSQTSPVQYKIRVTTGLPYYLPNLCAVLEYRRSTRLRPLRVNPHRPPSTW